VVGDRVRSISGTLLAGEKRSTQREICPGATLFTINATWTGLGSVYVFIKVIPQLFSMIKRFGELNNSWVNETILLKVFMIAYFYIFMPIEFSYYECLICLKDRRT